MSASTGSGRSSGCAVGTLFTKEEQPQGRRTPPGVWCPDLGCWGLLAPRTRSSGSPWALGKPKSSPQSIYFLSCLAYPTAVPRLIPLLCRTAQFTVVGPADPVLAMVGEDTTFHCHLSPEKNAEDMEVRWFRTHFSRAVLVYKGGRERTEEQLEEFRGRTTFVSDGIKQGSVALVIHNVTAHENGIYHCYFQEGRSYDEAIMRLMVAGVSLHFARLPFQCRSQGNLLSSLQARGRPAHLCLESSLSGESGFLLPQDHCGHRPPATLWASILGTQLQP